MLRQAVRRAIPLRVRHEIVALREVLLDGWRYQRATTPKRRATSQETRGDQHEARLTMDYHRIEKGLALPQPKQPFGAAVRERMVDLLAETPPPNSEGRYVELAEQAVSALDQWNAEGEIESSVTPLLSDPFAGISPDEAIRFFGSRHSVRNYDPSRVPSTSELADGVALASNTPSVCNRQAFRVHFYRDRDEIDAILRIQNGATAFAQTVPALGVVTARRAMFVGPDERNQRWVDGGLFAMTLVWAFHALGLSTCMLNWALPNVSSNRLRELAGIPNGEDIVVLIAIGHAAEGARVARSEKRSIDDLGIFHS